jgi:hypothetical protein
VELNVILFALEVAKCIFQFGGENVMGGIQVEAPGRINRRSEPATFCLSSYGRVRQYRRRNSASPLVNQLELDLLSQIK